VKRGGRRRGRRRSGRRGRGEERRDSYCVVRIIIDSTVKTKQIHAIKLSIHSIACTYNTRGIQQLFNIGFINLKNGKK
jgi:hypothetical protein